VDLGCRSGLRVRLLRINGAFGGGGAGTEWRSFLTGQCSKGFERLFLSLPLDGDLGLGIVVCSNATGWIGCLQGHIGKSRCD
jgi:hypothetical protein